MIWLDRLLRRGRIYDDLDAEIKAHLEQKTDDLMAHGMSRADATAAARRAFGNVTRQQEEGRDVWQWPTLESIAMDVRFAFRQLRRLPGHTAIIMLTLGLGIAATTTVFSWTHAILLDTLPGATDPGRVMALESTTPSGSWTPTSWLDFRDFRIYLKSFDGLAAAYPNTFAMGEDAHAERRWGELVSGNFFEVLGVRPALGRFFSASVDSSEGGEPEVVIGYSLWQSRFHGDSAVVGSVVNINRYPFTIIGVAPAAFHGSMPGEEMDLWVPASLVKQIVPTGHHMLRDRAWRTFRVLARLSPGVTPAAAREEVQRFATFMAKANGGRSEGMSAILLPIWKSHWGIQDALRAPLMVLLGACLVVLLIVCANTSSLLLARATSRQREFSLRMALGAPRPRLVRQLITEASLLAFGGAALGLLCTVWLSRSLHWLMPSFVAPSMLDPHVEGSTLALTVALGCAVTLFVGIVPALNGSRDRLSEALKEGGRGGISGIQATRLRSILVVAEMALAVVSLVGAGLFFDSYRQTRSVSPGFDADHVATGAVQLTLAGFDSAHAYGFLDRVTERLRREPGVSAVSYTDYVPLSVGSGSWEDLEVEGYAPAHLENMKLYRAAIAPDYFAVLRIPMLEGREFRVDDDTMRTPVMIVNRAFVQHFLPGRAVIGTKVKGWGKWFTIVGVVPDTKTYRLTERPTPYFYVPVRQVYRPEYGYTFLVRSTSPPEQVIRTIQDAVRSADPGVPVFNTMVLSDYIDAPLRAVRSGARLLAFLAGVALLLAAMGLYGVMAFVTAQRAKEIGVRMALGARPADVLGLIASRAGLLLGGGLAIGLAASIALRQVVSSLLYALSPGDFRVFGAAVGGIAMIGLVAAAIPAWRAMRIDPAIVLRTE